MTNRLNMYLYKIKQVSYRHSCHQRGFEHCAVSFTSSLYLRGLEGTKGTDYLRQQQ